MAVRASMADLIARVRLLIADSPTNGVFTDQQVQDACDFRRTEVRYSALIPQPTYLPGPTIVYLDYYSDAQHWESDIVLQDLSFNTLSPSLSEPIVGHWAFATQPNGIGVRATGKTFDIWSACADLLDAWAASVKLSTDFSTDFQSFKLSQKYQQLTDLSKEYRKRAQIQTARMWQGDANAETDGGGIVYPNTRLGGW